ncbi:hypothetical protein [Streptomyces chryseus]
MDTYAHGYGLTGHYATPGTHTSYCGRELMHEPNTGIRNRICQPCAKAEAADRTAAEQVAADRSIDGPTLAERAGMRYCLVGTGRRVHYSNNDATLCGREVSEYTDGLDERHDSLCSPCIKAAEKRAYTRALAAASPLAAAAVDLAETVEDADTETEQADVIRVAARGYRKAGSGRVETVTTVHTNCTCRMASTLLGTYATMAEAEQVAADRVEGTGRTYGHCTWSRPLKSSTADDVEAAPFDQVARAVDAVEHAEQAGAAVDTVEDAEALYAAALVTEAEADAGTWRGEWIGEQAGDALFAIEPAAEQGALFAPDSRPAREPIVARATFRPADLARITAKAAADRATYRAETDDRIAAECAAHGVAPSQGVRDRIAARAAEQAPARRVIEGVVVSHNGTAQGSTPANATHPNVIAARAALDGLAVATMTDHHDVSEPTEAEQDVRGYLVDPREGDRVAVYWLEGGRIIRRDTPLDGAALDCLADRLARRGWRVEKMLRSSQCVFAHRPSTD